MSAHAQAPVCLESSATSLGAGARRAHDLLLALIALLCLAPLLAAIAAAIWIESGGPVFFSQTRLGQDGKRFQLYKFRKFHARGAPGGPAVTLKDDHRMTRLGRLLERTKLDELPQLWNIVLGQMAIVGPRPESLAFADCFGDAYSRVLDHRPGIFGPCQVMFRNESAFYEPGCDPEEFYRRTLFPLKASVDLAYFPNRTLVSDTGWAIRGVLAVFGWAPPPHDAIPRAENVQDWARRSRQLAA